MEQKIEAWEDFRLVTGVFAMKHGSSGGDEVGS